MRFWPGNKQPLEKAIAGLSVIAKVWKAHVWRIPITNKIMILVVIGERPRKKGTA